MGTAEDEGKGDNFIKLLKQLNAEGEAAEVALDDFMKQVSKVRKTLIMEGFPVMLATEMAHEFFLCRMGITEGCREEDMQDDDD